jgi:pimeloyl-ACP methyl ester carboxylesterase
MLLSACAEETGRPATTAPSVTFLTQDGLKLRGHTFGSGDRWIILSHMFPTDQTAWYPFAGELSGRGFHVLTFDFRGYGESDGQKQIDRIDRDLSAAVGYVREQRPKRVILIGASMGGTASVMVAAAGTVDSLVALSAPDRFRGLNALALASAVKVPALLIAAEDDDGNPASARNLYDQMTSGERTLDIVKGAAHGIHLLEGPQGLKVRTDIFKFLDTNGG